MHLTEKAIYFRINHLTPSTVCFQKVLQLSNRVCILLLLISLWSEEQYFKLELSALLDHLEGFGTVY